MKLWYFSMLTPNSKKDLTQTQYMIPHQVEFDQPYPEFDLATPIDLKKVTLPSDDELNNVIDQLHYLCCVAKTAEKKELQSFHELSEKVLSIFKTSSYETLNSSDLKFFDAVLKSLDFKRIYSRDTKERPIFKKRCNTLIDHLSKPRTSWFEQSRVNHLKSEAQLLIKKLTFATEYSKFQPKLTTLDDQLTKSLTSLNEQTLGLESGSRLDFTSKNLVETLKSLEKLAAFCDAMEFETLNKAVQLSIVKEISQTVSWCSHFLEDFFEIFDKEVRFELDFLKTSIESNPAKTKQRKKVSSKQDSKRLIQDQKNYQNLLLSHHEVREALKQSKGSLKSYLERPNTWIEFAQSTTASLFSLPKNVLKTIAHPIAAITPSVESELEYWKGRFEQAVSKISQHSIASLNSDKHTLGFEKIDLKTLLDGLPSKEVLLPSRELNLRSKSQQSASKALEKLAKPDSLTYSRTQKVFVGALGLFAFGQLAQWGTSIYHESTTLPARAKSAQKLLFEQLTDTQKFVLDKEVHRLENFLEAYLPKQKGEIDFSNWLGFKNHPSVPQFLRDIKFADQIHKVGQNVSSIIDRFKHWRMSKMGQSEGLLPTMQKWWELFTSSKPSSLDEVKPEEKPEEFLAFLDHASSHPTFKKLISGTLKSEYDVHLNTEAMKYAKHYHSLEEGQRKFVSSQLQSLFELINHKPFFSNFGGLDKKTEQLVRVKLSTIHDVYKQFKSQKQTLPQSGYLKALIQGKSHPQSAHLLAHAVGDSFAKDTGLEGFNFTHMLTHVTEFMSFQNALGQTFFPVKLSSTLKRSLDFHKDFFDKDSPAKIDESQKEKMGILSATLKSYLEPLELGEPLIILGGWIGTERSAGHAISYEIYKQPNGQYTFRLDNRGAGIQNHLHYFEDGKAKIVPYIEKRNISLQDLLEPIFVTALFELQTVQFKSNKGMTSWGDNHIYKALISDASIKGDFYVGNLEDSNWVEPQISGTCAYQSLAQAIRMQVSEEQFHRFEIEFGIWNLNGFFNQLGASKPEDSLQQLLKKSIYAYSTSLISKLEKFSKLVSVEELQLINEKLSVMKSRLEQFDAEAKYVAMARDKDLVELKQAKAVALPKLSKDSQTHQSGLHNTRKRYSSIKDIKKITPAKIASISDPTVPFHKKLLKFSKEYYLESINEITRHISSLDFSSLSIREKNRAIINLSEFSKKIYTNLYGDIRFGKNQKSVTPSSYLPLMRLSLSMHKIVTKEIAESVGLSYPLNFLFMGYQKTKIPHFINPDPDTQKELQSIDAYLKGVGIIKDKIPVLFPYASQEKYGYQRISGGDEEINDSTDLTASGDSSNFLMGILIPSVARVLEKYHSDKDKPLWMQVGETLGLKNILDIKMPKVWKALMAKAVQMDHLCTNYHPSSGVVEFSTFATYEEGSFSKLKKVGYKTRYKGRRNFEFNLKPDKVSIYDKTVKGDVHSKGGHLFEMNFPKIEDPSLSYALSFWQAHLLHNREQRFELNENSFYKGELVDHLGTTSYWGLDFIVKSLNLGSIKSRTARPPKDVDADQILELLLLSEEPTLRIDRAIAYFQNPVNGKKILNKDYQTYLNLLLFSDNQLLKQLSEPKDGLVLASKLAKFFQNQHQRFVTESNYPLAVFFLRMNQQIQRIFKSVQPDALDPFIVARKELVDLLKIPSLSGLDKFYIHRAIAGSFLDTDRISSVKEFTDLMTSYTFFTSKKESYDSKQFLDQYLEEDIYKTIYRLLPSLQKIVSKNPSKYMNSLAQNIGLQFSESDTWEIDRSYGFPNILCTSQDASYDLFQGSFLLEKKAKAISELPLSCTEHPTYRTVFGHRNFAGTKYDSNFFTFYDDHGDLHKLRGKASLEKMYKSVAYTYVDADEFIDQVGVRFKNLNLIKGYTHWISSSSKGRQQVLFVDQKSGEKVFESDFDSHEVKHIETGRVLINPMTTPLKFTTDFENTKFINIFSTIDKKSISEVEFPRLIAVDKKPLKFKAMGNRRLACLNYPGLYLSSKKSLFHKEGYNLIVLENESKQAVKALMSPYFIDQSDHEKVSQKGLDRSLELDLKPDAIGERFGLFEYNLSDLDHADGPTLLPASKGGALYLVYSYLRAYEYKNALKELNSLKSTFKALTTQEIDSLMSILSMSLQNNDNDPKAIAIETLAGYILIDNLARFDTQLTDSYQNKIQKLITDVYSKYLLRRSYVNTFELNPYEEFQILDFVKRSSLFESRREVLAKDLKLDEKKPVLKGPSIVQLPHLGPRRLDPLNIIKILEQLKTTILNNPKFLSGLEQLLKVLNLPFILQIKGIKGVNEPASLLSPAVSDFPKKLLEFYRYAKEYNARRNEGSITYDHFKQNLFFSQYNHGQKKDETDDNVSSSMRAFADFLVLVAEYPDYFPSVDELLGYFEEDGYHLYSKSLGRTAKLGLLISDLVSSTMHAVASRQFYSLFDFSKSQSRKTIEVAVPKKKIKEKKEATALEGLKELNLSPSPASKRHVLKSLNDALEVHSTVRTPQSEQYFAHLQETVFKQNFEEEFSSLEFKSVKSDCEHYLFKESPQPAYRLKTNENGLDLLISTLKADSQNPGSIASHKLALKEKERQLIELANIEPRNLFEKQSHQLAINAQKKSKLTLDDLLLTFTKQDSRGYSKLNPSLSSDQIVLLNHQLRDYLVESTHLQQLQRVFVAANHVKDASLSKEDKSQWVQKLGEFGFAQRNYDIAKHPIYLVFEHYSDKLLYPKQVEKLAELEKAAREKRDSSELGLIIEAIMGFGKSKVILPLLSIHLADKETLPLVVMPDSLIESVGQEIRETVDHFSQKLKVIEFTRKTKCTPKKLEELDTLLTAAIANQDAVVFSSSSLQSMYLKFIELLYYGNKDSAHDLANIKLFQSIFKKLKYSSLPVFDEADLLFNCRHETHFTLASSTGISPQHLDLSTIIYEMIVDADIAGDYNFDFLMFNAQSNPISINHYNNQIKAKLAQGVIKKLSSDKRFYFPAMSKFLRGLSIEETQAFHDYLVGKSSEIVDMFISEIEDEVVANIIALAQAQLNIFLPLTLNRKLFEHYGPATIDGEVLAIPYHHGKASSTSQFGNQYEVINYTIQHYLKNGISEDIIRQEIQMLKDEASNFLVLFPDRSLEQIPAFQDLKKIYPEATGFELSDKDLKKATESVNNSYELKLSMTRKYFLPKVKIYSNRISANPQVFKHIFDTILGFTGTMWNAETFPTQIETHSSLGILGNTITQIIKKSDPKVTVIESEQTALLNLGELIKKPSTSAFIDLNGYFDFVDRKDVCREILKTKKSQGYKGVAYYNEEGLLMVMTHDDKPPVEFSKSNLAKTPEQRFTLYDHQRTTGADVSQAPNARAMMAVGKHTILRDLAQAAWRMRGLEKGQAIDFVVTEQDRQIILAKLNLEDTTELSLENIISYSIINQLEIKAGDNLLSQKQKIKAVIEKHVLEQLFNQNLDAKETLNVFSEFKSLFISEVQDEPRKQYSHVEQLTESVEILNSYVEHLSSQYKDLFSSREWKQIETEIQDCIEPKFLPKQSLFGKHKGVADLEQEIEVETEVETKVKTEVETETKKQVQAHGPSCSVSKLTWANTVFPYNAALDLNAILPNAGQNYASHPTSSKTGSLTISRMTSLVGSKYDFFDSNIYGTSNLFQILTSKFFNIPGYSLISDLYGSCQNPCLEALVTQTDQGIQVVMLDIKEAAEWKKFINQRDKIGSSSTQSLAFVVNLQTGEIERPDSKFEKELLSVQASDRYQLLIMQAKLLSGIMTFTTDEINLLEKWVEANSINRVLLKNFIVNTVLSQRPSSVVIFDNTPLGRALSSKEAPTLKV
ncbi:MAG: hypothetical protein S4CHLAM6_12400 [Chlamydiae bacterium]|nr:hypothetical protein [Chlamydiota bacterium]